jgi:hypothetical protein
MQPSQPESKYTTVRHVAVWAAIPEEAAHDSQGRLKRIITIQVLTVHVVRFLTPSSLKTNG